MRDFIYLETNQQLNDPVFDNRLWLATRNIDMPRRPFLDDVATSIYDYKGRILYKRNFIWPKPDIYEVFGGIDGRWISYYIKEVNGRPRHKPRPSTLERRRILSLYFHIRHPHIWRHFKR